MMKLLKIMIMVWSVMFYSLSGWMQTGAMATESPPQRALDGKLVFQAETDGDWEIYAINADGTHLIQLTDNTFADEQPRWSPDGQQIVFSSKRDGLYQIYVMQADGSQQTRLTSQSADAKEPAWSPDGRQIVFTSYQDDDNFYLFLMNANGTRVRQITSGHERSHLPHWSPDKQRIAYCAARYNLDWGIHLVTPKADQPPLRLTGSGDTQPAWSPDGTQIAYVSRKNSSKSSIWVMNADGSAKQDILADKNVEAISPTWSPDGAYIAYAQSAHRHDPNWDLAVTAVENRQHLELAPDPVQGIAPDWHRGRISEEIFALRGIAWPLRILYETEYSLHNTGKYRRDPEALNDRALVAHEGYEQGFMSYGPYTLFPAGDYTVSYRIKASDYTKKNTVLVWIDVATNRGKTSFARQELQGTHFQKKDRYQDFHLNFSLEQPQELEFRVWFFATATIWVDRITVMAKLPYKK